MMRWLWAAGTAVVVLAAGCEIGDTNESDAPDSESTAPPDQASSTQTNAATAQVSVQATNDTAAVQTATDADQAEWDAISWHTGSGPNCRGAARVMTLSAQVSGDGRSVAFGWDNYPWSDNGLGHFFVWDGSRWKGGKFEWIRAGGQKSKSLSSVHSGYNGLSAPPSGTPCAFAWTSASGKERSNLARTTWP